MDWNNQQCLTDLVFFNPFKSKKKPYIDIVNIFIAYDNYVLLFFAQGGWGNYIVLLTSFSIFDRYYGIKYHIYF